MRYFLHLAYIGTNFIGWQRQVFAQDTVQSVIEDRLSKVFRQKTTAYGCGRTDAGVHAIQFFAHFDTDHTINFDLTERLNYMLPHTIRIYNVIPVHPEAHARYNAYERSYIYHIHTKPNPYLWPYSTYYPLSDISLSVMEQGLQLLKELEDFKYLCHTPSRLGSTRCSLSEASVYLNEDKSQILFKFTSNRFLKSMIRVIVALLLELGTGRINIDQFILLINGRYQLSHPATAYPQGLHLLSVKYPYLEIPPHNHPFVNKFPGFNG